MRERNATSEEGHETEMEEISCKREQNEEEDRERERKSTYKTRRRRIVLSESRKGLDEDGERGRKRERESKSSVLSLVHERVTLVSLEGKRQRGREEVKETVGGRKRE